VIFAQVSIVHVRSDGLNRDHGTGLTVVLPCHVTEVISSVL